MLIVTLLLVVAIIVTIKRSVIYAENSNLYVIEMVLFQIDIMVIDDDHTKKQNQSNQKYCNQ